MKRRAWLTGAVLVLSLGLLAPAAPAPAGEQTVTGFVTDSHCKGDGAKDGHRECALKCAREKGGKLGVWDAAAGRFYPLQDQAQAEEFAGYRVTARGTLDAAGVLKASSIVRTPPRS